MDYIYLVEYTALLLAYMFLKRILKKLFLKKRYMVVCQTGEHLNVDINVSSAEDIATPEIKEKLMRAFVNRAHDLCNQAFDIIDELCEQDIIPERIAITLRWRFFHHKQHTFYRNEDKNGSHFCCRSYTIPVDNTKLDQNTETVERWHRLNSEIAQLVMHQEKIELWL